MEFGSSEFRMPFGPKNDWDGKGEMTLVARQVR